MRQLVGVLLTIRRHNDRKAVALLVGYDPVQGRGKPLRRSRRVLLLNFEVVILLDEGVGREISSVPVWGALLVTIEETDCVLLMVVRGSARSRLLLRQLHERMAQPSLIQVKVAALLAEQIGLREVLVQV